MTRIYATGKRKSAIAKVWIKTGKGSLIINNKNIDEWLGGRDSVKMKVMQPLVLTKQEKSLDILAVTFGGGYNAQAEAVRHGISKALNLYDQSFRKILKPYGLLTRDSRVVERKKFGKKKARRSPQFSKR